MTVPPPENTLFRGVPFVNDALPGAAAEPSYSKAPSSNATLVNVPPVALPMISVTVVPEAG